MNRTGSLVVFLYINNLQNAYLKPIIHNFADYANLLFPNFKALEAMNP